MALVGACVFSVSVLGDFKVEGFCDPAAEVGALAGFSEIVVIKTGAEFTKTGSLDGIGLPSFVCSFTT